MKKHAKVMLLMIMTLLVIVLTIQVTFAWLSRIERSAPIIIETGSLKLNTSLFVLEDDEYNPITSAIYFQDVIPGESYHFKVIFENKGTVNGVLTFSINDLSSTIVDTLTSFQIEFINPSTADLMAIEFNQHQNGSITLFENYLVFDKYHENNKLEFFFTINVLDTLGSISKNDVVKINSFLANIIQYH